MSFELYIDWNFLRPWMGSVFFKCSVLLRPRRYTKEMRPIEYLFSCRTKMFEYVIKDMMFSWYAKT